MPEIPERPPRLLTGGVITKPLIPIQKVSVEDLTPEELAVIDQLAKYGVARRDIRAVYRSAPMFDADNAGKHDLLAEVSVPEFPWREQCQSAMPGIAVVWRFYGYVYNCIEPDFSEFGFIYVDGEERYRIL